MSLTTSETLDPTTESRAAERRLRLEHLAWMVFKFIAERHAGETNHEFDGVEDAGLIAALKVSGFSAERIGCLDLGDTVVVQVEGIDGLDSILRFSLLEPCFSILVARVQVTKLPIVGREGRVDGTYQRMNILEEHSQRFKFAKLTTINHDDEKEQPF